LHTYLYQHLIMMKLSEMFVTIASENLDALLVFYAQLLGITPTVHHSDRYGEFCLPGFKLVFFTPQESQRSEFLPVDKSAFSLCLEVGDLDAAIAQLTAIGYPPSGEILLTSHGREIYAYDPEGNRLIVHEARS